MACAGAALPPAGAGDGEARSQSAYKPDGGISPHSDAAGDAAGEAPGEARSQAANKPAGAAASAKLAASSLGLGDAAGDAPAACRASPGGGGKRGFGGSRSGVPSEGIKLTGVPKSPSCQKARKLQ